MKKLIISLAFALAALSVGAQVIQPFGAATNAATAASAASVSVPTVSKGGSGPMELMGVCLGTVNCFYRYDGVTATTSNGFVLPAGQTQQIKIPATTSTFSVISTGAGSVMYLFAIR